MADRILPKDEPDKSEANYITYNVTDRSNNGFLYMSHQRWFVFSSVSILNFIFFYGTAWGFVIGIAVLTLAVQSVYVHWKTKRREKGKNGSVNYSAAYDPPHRLPSWKWVE